MPESLRLLALAATFFVMSYIGVAWIMAGAPTFAAPELLPLRLTSLAAPLPARVAPAPAAEPAPAPVALPAGDGHPQRDPMRLAALQASTAYTRNPCDPAAKAAMVETVTHYARAWADMMGCGPDGCDYRRINATAAVFSTPLDLQLREAIGKAFDQRGIAIEDFPPPLRMNVAMLVRGRGSPVAACAETRAQAAR